VIARHVKFILALFLLTPLTATDPAAAQPPVKVLQAGLKGAVDCIEAFSETDHTDDLRKFDVPTHIINGDDDQIVPIGASAMLSSKLIKGSTLKVYAGAPHGLPATHKDRVNADLLNFLERGD